MTTLVVGISGLSSSGKTTLARLMRSALQEASESALIVYQDDYFVPDAEVLVRDDGLQDWDRAEAIDWRRLRRVLEHIRATGALPSDSTSLQESCPVGEAEAVPAALLQRIGRRLADALGGCQGRQEAKEAKEVKEGQEGQNRRTIAILDGFLLLQRDCPIQDLLDVSILLRAPYLVAKKRREERMDYVTVEGYWADPPGYFDKVVWPNYCLDHRYLFVDGDVEHGAVRPEVALAKRIHSPSLSPSSSLSSGELLEWAVEIVINALGTTAAATTTNNTATTAAAAITGQEE